MKELRSTAPCSLLNLTAGMAVATFALVMLAMMTYVFASFGAAEPTAEPKPTAKLRTVAPKYASSVIASELHDQTPWPVYASYLIPNDSDRAFQAYQPWISKALAYNALAEFRAFQIREGKLNSACVLVLIKRHDNDKWNYVLGEINGAPCAVAVMGTTDSRAWRVIVNPESDRASVYNITLEDRGSIGFERDFAVEKDNQEFRRKSGLSDSRELN